MIFSMAVQNISDIPDSEIREQYRMFCRCLEKLKKEDFEHVNRDSKDLIIHFLSTEYELYDGIELIMHITTSAAVKISTESVVESKVSIFERHSTSQGKGSVKL